MKKAASLVPGGLFDFSILPITEFNASAKLLRFGDPSAGPCDPL